MFKLVRVVVPGCGVQVCKSCRILTKSVLCSGPIYLKSVANGFKIALFEEDFIARYITLKYPN